MLTTSFKLASINCFLICSSPAVICCAMRCSSPAVSSRFGPMSHRYWPMLSVCSSIMMESLSLPGEAPVAISPEKRKGALLLEGSRYPPLLHLLVHLPSSGLDIQEDKAARK